MAAVFAATKNLITKQVMEDMLWHATRLQSPCRQTSPPEVSSSTFLRVLPNDLRIL